MLRTSLVVVALAVGGGAPLRAQTDAYARLGLTYASDLVRDLIVEPVDVEQGLAPSLVLGASLPFAPRYRVGIEAMLTTSSATAKGAEEFDIGSIRTGSATLGIVGPVFGALRWRAGLGVVSYWPSEEVGLFARGGSTRVLFGGGAEYRRTAFSGWDLTLAAGADWHRFNTDELEARGYSQGQAIGRVTLSVGLARAAR